MYRRERTGEMVDLDALEHNRDRCGGWLGEDREGRPIPCLICKPHLRKTVHHNDTRSYRA